MPWCSCSTHRFPNPPTGQRLVVDDVDGGVRSGVYFSLKAAELWQPPACPPASQPASRRSSLAGGQAGHAVGESDTNETTYVDTSLCGNSLDTASVAGMTETGGRASATMTIPAISFQLCRETCQRSFNSSHSKRETESTFPVSIEERIRSFWRSSSFLEYPKRAIMFWRALSSLSERTNVRTSKILDVRRKY